MQEKIDTRNEIMILEVHGWSFKSFSLIKLWVQNWVSTLINEIHTKARRLIWLAFLTLCFQTRRTLWQILLFFFFRTQFTATWVFLLLIRMQNGEKIKDSIIHFHILIVKVSQMGWISVKFSGCDYSKFQFFKVVLNLYTCILIVKKRFFLLIPLKSSHS